MNKDWGRFELLPQSIKKKECMKCKRHLDEPRGGNCAILFEKNREAYQNMGKTVNLRMKKK